MQYNNPIILIDGSSYLYRAFYATPKLTNKKGEPTGAIYGVTNMIKSLINQYKPSHIAVVFDAKGGSFRNQIYKEYKATRASMPDDLKPQVEPLFNLLKAMGLPILCVDGVEADDVIGTLAKEAESKNKKVLISTGDKDMAQLVSNNVTLINTMNNLVLDPNGVKEKFGVPPHKIIDFLALMGDSSDNIPGVKGIGEKTAISLLTHFESITHIYENIDLILNLPLRGVKSITKNLIENQKDALLSYELATIKTDVALSQTIEDLIYSKADHNKLKEIFEYHGFNRWLNELNQKKFINIDENIEDEALILTNDNNQKTETNYHCVLTQDAFNALIKQLNKCEFFAFDTETTSLDPLSAKLVGLSFSFKTNEAFYIPLMHRYEGAPDQLQTEAVITALKPIFENKNIKKIAQNAKFDYSVLLNYQIEVKSLHFDTMLESYVLNSNDKHDMDSLALKYLNKKTISYDELKKSNKKITIDQIEIEKVSHYACEDADITFQLHQVLYEKLSQDKLLLDLFNEIEMPLALILANIERTGVNIDKDKLNELSNELAQKLTQLESQIHILAGEEFNIASPKQLQIILFEKNKLPIIKKTPKGDPSTNEEVLTELAKQYELPQLILTYRGLAKLKNTYTDKLPLMTHPLDDKIHTNYNQIGTVTGRLSSNNPNLQNIPIRNEEGRKIRQTFTAKQGFKIVAADYSQIELRIMAHLSQDENLLDAFANDKDIHRFTASEILQKNEIEITTEERRRAKAVNFGLIYGMSAFGLSKQIDIPRNEAQFYIDSYFNRYPSVQNYMDNTRSLAAEKGYVETLSGRRLYLPKINSSNAIERKAAERAAINAPMQGTAADIIKKAMIDLNKWIYNLKSDDIKMIMQVHDELVFEIKEENVNAFTQKIKEIMEKGFKLKVPLKVEVGFGYNWDEAH